MLGDLDAVLLARIQFGFTVAFHILWPAYTIGVAGFIVALEGLWLLTGREVYRVAMRFWIKIFALGFAMGVVTGVVLSFQIGANWGGFAHMTGNVLGPLISLEVLTAFFLEAGFIGVMLFGLDRVGKGLHFMASCFVAVGTIVSAFWILAANSWMQSPAGFAIGPDGLFTATDWWAVVFNPSFPYRFAHMVCAAFLTATFVVAGVSAFHLLRREHLEVSRVTFGLAMLAAIVLAPLQVLIGDMHGLNTREVQPIKLAAMEGRWETARGVPLTLFAIPDEQAEKNHFEIDIPRLGSLILTHEWDGEVVGLKSVPPEDRPPVAIVFFAFRIMVGIGMLFVALAVTGLWLRIKGRLYETRWFHWACLAATPAGFVAVIAGWFVTEVGRQPWVVQGHLRTADAASAVPASSVAGSLTLFFIVYNLLLLAFFWYGYKLVKTGPDDRALDHAPRVQRGRFAPAE
jgi:cytochrome d ubiquinol oxidase subunit I